MIREINPEEVKALLLEDKQVSIIDVRERIEVLQGMIPEAMHIPMGEIPHRLHQLSKTKQYIIVCRSGARSGSVTHYLSSLGYDVLNMSGGMIEWKGSTSKKVV